MLFIFHNIIRLVHPLNEFIINNKSLIRKIRMLAFYREVYNCSNEKVDSNTFTATFRSYCIDSFVNELTIRDMKAMRQIREVTPRDQRVYLHGYNTVTKSARYLNLVPSSSEDALAFIRIISPTMQIVQHTTKSRSWIEWLRAPMRASNSFRLIFLSHAFFLNSVLVLFSALIVPIWSEDQGEKEQKSITATRKRNLASFSHLAYMGCFRFATYIHICVDIDSINKKVL